MTAKASGVVAEIKIHPYPEEKLLAHVWRIIVGIPATQQGKTGQPLKP
jgi:hypothetical protein